MQLAPLTQGGTQYWGYLVDEVSGNTTHISLHHRQNDDPLSYTQTVYASITTDDFESIGKCHRNPTSGSFENLPKKTDIRRFARGNQINTETPSSRLPWYGSEFR